MELQVGVKVLMSNKEGKFLLLERSKEKYGNTKGSWDIVGGRIEPGATLLDNLAREIFEETKLELTSAPKLIAAQDILLPDKGRHVVRLTYIARVDGTPVLDGDHVGYSWKSLREMAAMEDLDVYVKELIEKGVVSHETE